MYSINIYIYIHKVVTGKLKSLKKLNNLFIFNLFYFLFWSVNYIDYISHLFVKVIIQSFTLHSSASLSPPILEIETAHSTLSYRETAWNVKQSKRYMTLILWRVVIVSIKIGQILY